MTIDWITVTAQIVNFLILVGLLKRFLYQPVLDTMARREAAIGDRIQAASEREADARAAREQLEEQRAGLDSRREEILAAAREEARAEKKQLLEEARQEAADMRGNWLRQVEQEKAEFLADLRSSAGETILAVVRRALRDLADDDLERRIAAQFAGKLKSIDPSTRDAIARADGPARISTAFVADASLRSRLTRAVHDYLADGIDIDYAQSPDLLCGIELVRGGQRIDWNVAAYLEELAERVESGFGPGTQGGRR